MMTLGVMRGIRCADLPYSVNCIRATRHFIIIRRACLDLNQ